MISGGKNRSYLWLAFACSLLVLGAQVLESQHLHVDEEEHASCEFCLHVDSTPLPTNLPSQDPVVYHLQPGSQLPSIAFARSRAFSSYSSRAPPARF
ncbi:MAG: hypothetical protein AAF529_06510 [Pseudomonadota bacterium]